MVGDEVDERVAVQMLKRLERPDGCVWVGGCVRVWVCACAAACVGACACM